MNENVKVHCITDNTPNTIHATSASVYRTTHTHTINHEITNVKLTNKKNSTVVVCLALGKLCTKQNTENISDKNDRQK